ncbi:hypothetical protein [Haloarchaeobius sp. DFWS5]|uniref:hypothetical protein n=1 Tax=Haloarchaeobius sp. DFWS5 TaxID=3446114 RepID=UPI003EC08FF1
MFDVLQQTVATTVLLSFVAYGTLRFYGSRIVQQTGDERLQRLRGTAALAMIVFGLVAIFGSLLAGSHEVGEAVASNRMLVDFVGMAVVACCVWLVVTAVYRGARPAMLTLADDDRHVVVRTARFAQQLGVTLVLLTVAIFLFTRFRASEPVVQVGAHIGLVLVFTVFYLGQAPLIRMNNQVLDLTASERERLTACWPADYPTPKFVVTATTEELQHSCLWTPGREQATISKRLLDEADDHELRGALALAAAQRKHRLHAVRISLVHLVVVLSAVIRPVGTYYVGFAVIVLVMAGWAVYTRRTVRAADETAAQWVESDCVKAAIDLRATSGDLQESRGALGSRLHPNPATSKRMEYLS